MRIEVTRGQQTVVSYAILLAALGVLASFALGSPIVERAAFFERLESLRELYARSSAVVAEGAARREAAREAPEAAAEGAYFEGETAALAGAELQNLVKDVVEGQGAVLVSSAFREHRESLPLTPITVAVRARTSVAALQQILYALERNEPVLFVDSLSIQSRHRAARTLRDLNEELDVEFDVTGYLTRPHEP